MPGRNPSISTPARVPACASGSGAVVERRPGLSISNFKVGTFFLILSAT
jgi:hypothetical protein